MPAARTLIFGTVAALFTGCAAPHAYVGVQNVTPLAHVQDTRWPDSGSAYVNLLFPIGDQWSVQIEPIVPFDQANPPLLRLAVDVKIF